MANTYCANFSNGFCVCFDEDKDFEDLPAGCDQEGLCGDEYDETCDDYEPADDTCGDCGNLYENCDCEDEE